MRLRWALSLEKAIAYDFVSQMVHDRDPRRDSIMVAVWNERLDPDDMEDPEPVCLSSLLEAARLPCDPV